MSTTYPLFDSNGIPHEEANVLFVMKTRPRWRKRSLAERIHTEKQKKESKSFLNTNDL